jgi:hypothetical protein
LEGRIGGSFIGYMPYLTAYLSGDILVREREERVIYKLNVSSS